MIYGGELRFEWGEHEDAPALVGQLRDAFLNEEQLRLTLTGDGHELPQVLYTVVGFDSGYDAGKGMWTSVATLASVAP